MQSLTIAILFACSKNFNNEVKKDYKFDHETQAQKLRPDGKSLTCNGKECEYLRKDYQHSEIEAFDKRGNHLGALDPVTKRQVKGPKPGRILKKNR